MVWLPSIIFSHILRMSSSQVTNSYFSEGWPNHQPDNVQTSLVSRYPSTSWPRDNSVPCPAMWSPSAFPRCLGQDFLMLPTKHDYWWLLVIIGDYWWLLVIIGYHLYTEHGLLTITFFVDLTGVFFGLARGGWFFVFFGGVFCCSLEVWFFCGISKKALIGNQFADL